MSAGCGHQHATFEGLSADYKRRLWLVIAINAVMFFVEMAAGAIAGSQAFTFWFSVFRGPKSWAWSARSRSPPMSRACCC